MGEKMKDTRKGRERKRGKRTDC